MSRSLRKSVGGIVYHVMNRANARMVIFKKRGDYEAFENVLFEAHERMAMRMLGYCLMNNHWHIVLWPYEDGDLSEFMRWVTVTHTQRWHGAHGTAGSGHVYQGRFKSFPVQSDEHYLTVMRYVERNPLRAGVVQRAQDWPWSSMRLRVAGDNKEIRPPISSGPVALANNWVRLVNCVQTSKEEEALQNCIKRGRPFGSDVWITRIASQLGLGSTLKSRGRPKKEDKKGS